MPASAMAVSRCRRLASAGMSPSSESYWNELVVVDRLGLRHGAEDSELLERMPEDVDPRRAPGAGAREAGDLRVVDFGGDAGLDLDGPGLGCHDEIFVRPHEGDGLEPAAQETPQQVRPLVDAVVGCKDDVSVEILRDIAAQDEVSGLAGLLQLVTVRRLDHHVVEFSALDGSEPRLHLASRNDLDAVSASGRFL